MFKFEKIQEDQLKSIDFTNTGATILIYMVFKIREVAGKIRCIL